MGQRSGVELYLDFGKSELRAEGLARRTEPYIFGDNPLIPPPPKARKLKINAAVAEFSDHALLYEAWESNLVKVNQGPEQNQQEDPNANAEPAKVDPA
jgi:hypothetical protein